MTEAEIKYAQRELKVRRNTRLKNLYTDEAAMSHFYSGGRNNLLKED